MATLILGFVIVLVVVMFFGFSKSSGARKASRVVSFLIFAVFGVIAAASVYGMVALNSKGGGVLLFVAIPCGFIAWMAFGAFASSTAHEGYYDLSVAGKIAYNETLLDSQIREHDATIAENTEKLKSFWISPKKRRRLRDDVRHARFMKQSLTSMKVNGADPTIYQGDEATRVSRRS